MSTPANNGSSQERGSSEPGAAEGAETALPLPFFPAGLQLLYESQRESLRSLDHAFFLAAHWALIRGGLRRTTTPLNLPGSYEARRELSTGSAALENPEATSTSTAAGSGGVAATPAPVGVGGSPLGPAAAPAEVLAALTEMPEPGWADRIAQVREKPIIFQYMNPLALEEGYYRLEFYALNDSDMILRITNRYAPAARKQYLSKTPDQVVQGQSQQYDPKGTQAANFIMPDYVQFGPQIQTAIQTFYKASALERQIFKYLFEGMGLPVYGVVPPGIGIYDDPPAATPAQRPNQTRPRDYREDYGFNYDDRNPYQPNYPRRPLPNPGGFGGPLHAPPVGGGGLGRSDLDPLGGVGAGMLADPRGFRRPGTGPPIYPGMGGLPPGARFDPFGPVGPGRGPPGPPGPGRIPGQFGGPNPDHEQPPPGFEDMFM